MKETRKARIIYNSKEDMFEVQINTGDGWGLEKGYRCVAREGGDGTTDFISWRIVDTIQKLTALGYKFVNSPAGEVN